MTDIATVFIFGFILAISVGPIALIVVLNGVKHGRVAAIKSAFGAASGDFVFAFISFLLGGAIFSALVEAREGLEILSSLILVAFGLYICFQALRSKVFDQHTKPQGNPFLTTFCLTIVNPLTIIAFIALVGQITVTGNFSQALVLASVLFAGSFLAQLIYALVSSSMRSLLSKPNMVMCLQLFSGIGILAFGVRGFIS